MIAGKVSRARRAVRAGALRLRRSRQFAFRADQSAWTGRDVIVVVPQQDARQWGRRRRLFRQPAAACARRHHPERGKRADAGAGARQKPAFPSEIKAVRADSGLQMIVTSGYMKAAFRAFPAPGWAGVEQPVARQAHNLKVTGSNPVPATKLSPSNQAAKPALAGFLFGAGRCLFSTGRCKSGPAASARLPLSATWERASFISDC